MNQSFESKRLSENFAEPAPAIFCVLKGPEHIFEFTNPAFRETFKTGDLKGKTAATSFPQWKDAGLIELLDNTFYRGNAFTGKELYVPVDEEAGIHADITCQAVCDEQNKVSGILVFGHNVTTHMINRPETEVNMTGPEKEVLEKLSRLQTANISLEQSNKNLKEFASIACHDMQEPLRKIRTYTDLLKKELKDTVPAKAQQYLNKVEESAVRMSTLIRDMLNYSKVISSETIMYPTDLGQVLKHVIGDLELVTDEKKATISVESNLPVIEANPVHMNQLFLNILGNALKFTHKQRNPEITIRYEWLSGYAGLQVNIPDPLKKYICITITDNGIGFGNEFAEQIFSTFVKLNSVNEYEGSGIGLAICRKIVENHQGVIWAESKEGEATSFYIVLPESQ